MGLNVKSLSMMTCASSLRTRVARAATEVPPSIQWRRGRLITSLLYRNAFNQIGPKTTIIKPRILRGVERINIGHRVIILEGAWLQTEGEATLRIGDDCYFGHQVHIHAVDDVFIGDRTLIGEGTLITTADHQKEDRHKITPTGAVRVGSDVFIGQGVIVLGGVTIGDRATVAAGAVVTANVPDGMTVVGIPARVVGLPKP